MAPRRPQPLSWGTVLARSTHYSLNISIVGYKAKVVKESNRPISIYTPFPNHLTAPNTKPLSPSRSPYSQTTSRLLVPYEHPSLNPLVAHCILRFPTPAPHTKRTSYTAVQQPAVASELASLSYLESSWPHTRHTPYSSGYYSVMMVISPGRWVPPPPRRSPLKWPIVPSRTTAVRWQLLLGQAPPRGCRTRPHRLLPLRRKLATALSSAARSVRTV